MQLSQLISQLRIDLDDAIEDYLWSNAELTAYINEAYKEAVRRARLIIDSATPEVCTINVVADTALYPLSKKIYRVLDIFPSWDNRQLCKVTTKELNLQRSTWRTQESDKPDYYVSDFQSGAIRLYPIPTEAGTLNLRVYRLPLVDLINDTDEPEINEAYHIKLLHWARHKAYLKPDADTFDKNASMEALALFVQEFGEAKSAWSDEFDERNLPNDLIDGSY